MGEQCPRRPGATRVWKKPRTTRLHEVVPFRSVYGLSPLTAHLSDALAENRLRTANTSPLFLFMATMEGSFTTIPFPLT